MKVMNADVIDGLRQLDELGRGAVLIELNPEYCKLIDKRLRGVTYGLPLSSAEPSTLNAQPAAL